MSDSTISGRGKEPFLHAKTHSSGKENKPKVGSLEARSPENSKEATTSRAKKTLDKTGVLKEGVNSSFHVRAVGVGEKGMPPTKLNQIESEILSFGKIALEPQGEKRTEKKVKEKMVFDKLRDIVSFINAGGLEVYKKIAAHYDALASEAIDPKQKEVYKKISDTYLAKVASIDDRKNELNSKLPKLMSHSPLKERAFSGKVDKGIMKRIESMTKTLIDETDNRILMTEGYITKPKEGFTDEFNKKLTASYAAEPTAKERAVPYVLNGEEQSVCTLAYMDLNRSTYVLEGRKLSAETFPHFDEDAFKKEAQAKGIDAAEIKKMAEAKNEEVAKLQIDWKSELIKIFLEFCGYDENADYESEEDRVNTRKAAEAKLFKLSQCMCQEMGNGYVVTSGESENSPQKIAGKPFTVPDSAGDLERHFEIDKVEDGSIVLRSIDRIKNINFIMRNGAMIDTHPEETSLNLEVGIVLNANNEWEAYEGGSIEFQVNVVNTKANMKSLFS